MRYFAANESYTEAIHNVVQTTIKSVYPKYYPQGVVDFFCELHSMDHIREGVASGNMGVLVDNNGAVIGTGCFDENHITGVYVLPEAQSNGCGTQIIKQLEDAIALTSDTAVLEASLPAVRIYEHLGYRTTGHGVIDLENGVKLVFEKMQKQLR